MSRPLLVLCGAALVAALLVLWVARRPLVLEAAGHDALAPTALAPDEPPERDATRASLAAPPPADRVEAVASVEPSPSDATTAPTAPPAPVAWLSGRVVDSSGTPLAAEIEVFLQSGQGRSDLFHVPTDANGYWREPPGFGEQRLGSRLTEHAMRNDRSARRAYERTWRDLEKSLEDARRDRGRRRRRGSPGSGRRPGRDPLRELETEDLPEPVTHQLGLLLSERRAATSELCVRATAHGYTPERTCLPVPEDSPWRRTVDFVLARGGAVHGAVLWNDAPVLAAEVQLLDLDFRTLTTTRTDGSGHWELSVEESGTYHVLARHEGLGHAWHTDVGLTPAFVQELPTLHLTGPGLIRGNVTYPDGTPVRALVVRAEPLELAANDDDRTPLDRLPPTRARELFRAAAVTDRWGDFELLGLHPGEYALELADSDPQEPLVVSTPVHAVALVYPHHRLFVSVDQPSGTAPPWVRVTELAPDSNERPADDAIPRRTRLEPQAPRFGRPTRGDPFDGGAFVPAVFRIEPDTRYTVTAWSALGEDRSFAHVSRRSFETWAWLSLARPRPKTEKRSTVNPRLRIEVIDELDQPIPEVLVTLRDGQGRPLREWNRAPLDPSGPWISVAPGAYRLRCEASAAGFLSSVADDEIELEAGATSRWVRRGTVGGRIAVQVQPTNDKLRLRFELHGTREHTLSALSPTDVALDADATLTAGRWVLDPPVPAGDAILKIFAAGADDTWTTIVREKVRIVSAHVLELETVLRGR